MVAGAESSGSRIAPAWLRALGADEPPETVTAAGRAYRHVRTFKHDFFAATCAYIHSNHKIIVKTGRRASLFFLPSEWIGRLLARHETRMFQLFQSIDGVPALVARIGPTGLAHEFVEGRNLRRGDAVSDEFFPRLAAMLDEIHRRDAAYVDLEKPENVLVGDDGRPYLVDFQIAWHLPANRGGRTAAARWLLRVLQDADRYHLLKHRRRFRPDQLTAEELAASQRPPPWIAWHRTLFRPVTRWRRRILTWLGARDSPAGRSPG